MKDSWFCILAGQQVGPVPFSRLRQLAQAGRLTADDCVRRETDVEWTVASDIPSLLPEIKITPDVAESIPKPHAEKRRASSSLPVAKPLVESASAAAPPPPRGTPLPSSPVPVGKALPPPPREASSTGHAAALFVDSDASDPLHRHARKKGNPAVPLVVGGAAVVGILGSVLLLVLSGAFNTTPEETTSSADESTTPVGLANLSPEEIEAAAAKALEVSSTTAVATTTPAPASSLLKSITKWNDVSRLKNLKLGPATISFTGLWLSLSDKGDPIEGEESSRAKYLVVKLKIENATGAAPMNYLGWGREALLVDEAGDPIRPIDSNTAAQRIEPGGSFADTLVFPLKKPDFGSLRLALPHETVGIKDDRCFAFELPRHALGRGLDTRSVPAAPVAARVAEGGAPGIIDESIPTPEEVVKLPGDDVKMEKKPEKPKADEDDLGLDKLKAKADMLDKMEKPK